jgi:hypothetical protein
LPARLTAIGGDSERFVEPGLESHRGHPQRRVPAGCKKLGITNAQTIVVGRFLPKAATSRASMQHEKGAACEQSRAQGKSRNASATPRYGTIMTGEPTLTRS